MTAASELQAGGGSGSAPRVAEAAPMQQDEPVQRSKKQTGRKKGKSGVQEEVNLTAGQADHVRPIKSDRRDANSDDAHVVQLSKVGKAAQLQLSEDRLSATGHKGHRTVRCSHGVYEGTWYCEVTMTSLGKTGHARVGWCTRKAELQASVGFDAFGFGLRDVDGSKVHKGLREDYGVGFKEGDVVGLLIHLPPGGRPLEVADRSVVRYKGSLYYAQETEPQPQTLPGSIIAFTVNGVAQGAAYKDFNDGTYYPAASLYTMPEQTEGATVTFNFGPDFKYKPPQLEGMGVPCPMCERATPREPTPAPTAPSPTPPPAAASAAGAQAEPQSRQHTALAVSNQQTAGDNMALLSCSS